MAEGKKGVSSSGKDSATKPRTHPESKKSVSEKSPSTASLVSKDTEDSTSIKTESHNTKTSHQSTKTSAAENASAIEGKTPPLSPRKKSNAKDKAQDKGTEAKTSASLTKTKCSSHEATVLRVSQDSPNCTPLAALKPAAASTPDLCYTGTEDIIPKDGSKSVKTKRKPGPKKENKIAVKHKLVHKNSDLPVKKKVKRDKNNSNEDKDVCELASVKVKEASVTDPIKKEKRMKKTQCALMEDGSPKEEETSAIQKKKAETHKKNAKDAQKESEEVRGTGDLSAKKKPGPKKKRKASIENNDADSVSNPKTKRKTKADKKNSVSKVAPMKRKKAQQIKTEPLGNSNDLNLNAENKDEEDSIDLSVLINKKPTAESLALQATVEKLQGRLTPTMCQGNSANNGNTNGRNLESLQAMLPKLVSSRFDKETNDDKVQEWSGQPLQISSSVENADKKDTSTHCKDDNKPSESNTPLNLSHTREETKPLVSKDKGAESTRTFVRNSNKSSKSSSSQSAVLDLSNKEDKSVPVISEDGSIDLSKKDELEFMPQNKDKSVQQSADSKPVAHVNNVDKISDTAADKSDGEVGNAAELQSVNVKEGTQNNHADIKPAALSKSVKKERVESAIEKLFQKRDSTFASSGVKKQRVEKTIDMLLAKKEKSIELADGGQNVSENLQQKSFDSSETSKDNRS